MVDTLTDVLHNIRSSGALVGRTLAVPPWSARFDGGASLTLATMLRGDARLVAGCARHSLLPNDVALVVGPEPFEIVSEPVARPESYSESGPEPGQAAHATPIGEGSGIRNVRTDGTRLSDRRCRTQLESDHTLLTGSFHVSGRVADRLLDALPRVLVVPRRAQRSSVLPLLEEEIGRDEPGRQAVLDRLLDLALVGALRDWFALPGSQAPGWYRAGSDPVVGIALAAIHDAPEQPWTIELLAREALVSRATLARRFTDQVGDPPMSYLTGWRLCRAADLLDSETMTVETIAHEVGYSNAYALSAAFHREYGVRPGQYRHGRRSEGS